MFISALTSSDPRFKTLRFHDGLNILVADRTESSEQGDSRNSIGKTSFVRILRYLLGGDIPAELKSPELANHSFTATLHLPSVSGNGDDVVSLTRAISPSTRVSVEGWSVTNGSQDLHVDDWREILARQVFHIPDDVTRPTVGQLWAQLIRTHFGKPTKGHPSEADWESGVKLGYLLGLSPEILSQAGDLDRLSKQSKAIRAAVREGAINHLSLDEPALRAQVATARRQRDRAQEALRAFKVDDQYAAHQRTADNLTGAIQILNDEALGLQRRASELATALQEEISSVETTELTARLSRVYAELGIVLPESVGRRYDEVAAFHQSVVRNRQAFLQQERDAVNGRLASIEADRRRLDDERAGVMQLLSGTVALDTFLNAQRSLAKLEAETADLERRLDAAISISQISDTVKLRTAELISSVRTELNERTEALDVPISLFGELGTEIYTEKEVSLLISPTANGLLSVTPHVSGDASTGVRSVETFMLDMVCVISAVNISRAPRILVHDSHLFDAIDGRQVASCLNIGARLADQHGFQYIVTLNSDFLESVELQSDGAFDSAPYVLETRLTDATADGGLFGFRFD